MSRDFVFVLRHPKINQTKVWMADGSIKPSADGMYFIGKEFPVADIHDLSALLASLESDSRACVIRGAYRGYEYSLKVEPEQTKKGQVLRRKSVYEDVPHRWLLVDVDSYTSSKTDALLDPVGAIEGFISECLPKPFHGISFHWQLSSSAGHPSKPGDILKAHIWFWLRTAYTSAQLLAWAKATEFAGDKALLDTIQIHYTASPIFSSGVINPIKNRSGFYLGDFGNEVNLEIDESILAGSLGISSTLSRHQKIQEVLAGDPVVKLLYEKNLVKGKRGDGGLNIECPRKDKHSSVSGESSTIYYPAHTGGWQRAAFKCLHEHCRNAQQFLFLDAIGYDDTDDVFGSLDKTIRLLNGHEITPQPIHWLMRGWLAAGKLVLLAGSPGTGKTTIAMSFAGTISSGGKWPDGTSAERGTVVIWSGEDDPADTLVPRLLACGADLSRIKFVGNTVDLDGKRPFDPAKDMHLLLGAIEQIGDDCKFILVDPIVSAVAGDSHKNAEVRRGLQPLVDLAASLNAMLLGITHFTKGTGGKDTTERVTGSLAFAAQARIVLATARDRDAGDFILTRAKSNIGPDGSGFRYQLIQMALPKHPDVVSSRVEWGELLEGNARELITDAEGEIKEKNIGTAEKWLLDLLSLTPLKAADIYAMGKTEGYGERKLQRALSKIGGLSEKGGFQGQTWWRLAGDATPIAEIVKSDALGVTDDL